MPISELANLQGFLEVYKKNPERVALFIGAGLSMPLFPSWKQLIKEIINECFSQGKLHYNKEELLEMVEKGINYMEIAGECADALGQTKYREFLEKYFDILIDPNSIPDAYQMILNLPITTILTTNYDRIPEIAGKGQYTVYTNKNIPEASRAINDSKKVVVKLHGDITDQDSIVFTRSDYNRAIFNNEPLRNLLESIFSTRTVLFIGFGLYDPHIDLILSYLYSINKGITITHYALIASSSNFETAMIERKYGIRVISYTPSDASHPEVVEFIKSIFGIKEQSQGSKPLESREEVSSLFANQLKNEFGYTSFLLSFYDQGSTLSLSLVSKGRTEIELQKELLSIASRFKFEASFIKSIVITFHRATSPNESFEAFYQTRLMSSFSYEAAMRFARGEIDARKFWDTISFSIPRMIGTIESEIIRIEFPFIGVIP